MQKTALLSVYNKKGIVEFATSLNGLGFDILASGGTARTLTEASVPVTDVATIVGDPILGHRVVTLSREVHAGLLAKDNEEDRAELQKLGIRFIDLLCCDLYPLKEEVENPDATLESVIEKTDIGGPTMLRSAAKGNRITIIDYQDRILVLHGLRNGTIDNAFINRLAAKAEFRIAEYCMYSANFRGGNRYHATFTDYTGSAHDSLIKQIVVGKK
jgi:phosphoribosylaminoimidazolecarboxamide formyltransferase / IMP cyclohydrolase